MEQLKKLIKGGIVLRFLTFILALVVGGYQIQWLQDFMLRTCEWFQTPLPNYGDLLCANHVMMLLLCIAAIVLAINPSWHSKYKFVLIVLMYQAISFLLQVVYTCRWIYSYGEITKICWFLRFIPLLTVLILYLCKKVSVKLVIPFIGIDLLLYYWDACESYKVSFVQDFFILYNPYYNFFESALFAGVVVLIVILSDRISTASNL